MTRATEPPTLYAPITAAGRAAVVAVRLSGSAAFATLQALAGRVPPPRRMTRCRLSDPEDGTPIDDALVVAFPAPRSFTGEDVVEVHLHGGLVPLRRLLRALGRRPGLAPAGPGDFSRRAFLNGRLDLAQAEALADLIDAETEAQAQLAEGQRDQGLSAAVRAWRQRLLAVRAEVEARLDFADEGDVVGRGAAAVDDVVQLRAEVDAVRADRRAERLRTGLRVVLLGPPNAGKSSLLNALAARPVAIVDPRPGTTRDLLEVHLDLGGLPVTLVDTAGLRATDDPVEAEGVRRAEAAAATADLRLWLVDGALWPRVPPPGMALAPNDLRLLTKADLEPPGPHHLDGVGLVPVSVRSAEGLGPLLAALEVAARPLLAVGTTSLAWITRERHRHALDRAAERLGSATTQLDPVLLAEDLRAADAALASIVGDQGVEAVLDAIFRGFCIGK